MSLGPNIPPNIIPSAVNWVMDLLTFAPNVPPTQLQLENAAAARIFDKLKVKRIASNYVIEVGYTNESAALATRIANGIAKAYSRAELD